MEYLKQSTAATVKFGPFLDDTDGKTAETALAIAQADIRLSKNGGAFAQTNNAAGATHDEKGWYGVPLNTTDTATLGRLKVAIHESGALPCFAEFMVVTANVYDSLCSTDKFQVDVTQLLGTAWLAPGVAGTPDVNAKQLGGTAQTGRDVGADVLLSSGSGAGQLDFTSGVVKSNLAQILGTAITETAGQIAAAFKKLFNVGVPVLVASDVMRGTDGANTTVPDAAGVAATPAEVTTALTDINLDHLCKTATAGADMTAEVVDNSILSRILSNGDTSVFDPSTDGLQLIRDRGDAAWITGAGGSDRLLMVDTTIATLASQTSFTLTAGSTDDDAYNNCTIIIEDASTAAQKAVGVISNYAGGTKTVTLKYDPAIFTMATTDKVYILAENALKSTAANRQLNVAADGDIAGNVDGSVASVVGHTVQTGDSYAIVNNGTHGNAALETLIDEVESMLKDGTYGLSAIETLVDELETRLTAARAGYLDELAAANIPTDLSNIEADTQDIQSRIPAALVTGRMSSDAVAISGSTDAADKLEASAETIVTGAAVTGTLSTTQMTSDLTEATDDHFNGCVLIWKSGVLKDQRTNVTDYDGATKMLTYTATTEAPSNGDLFVLL